MHPSGSVRATAMAVALALMAAVTAVVVPSTAEPALASEADSYRDAVLAKGPAAYFRFDGPDPSDEVPHEPGAQWIALTNQYGVNRP